MFSKVTAALFTLFVAVTAFEQTTPQPPVALIESVVGGVVVPGAVTSVQANEGDLVQLTAQDSTDPNSPATPLTYLWTQISGPSGQSFAFTNALFNIIVPSVGGVGGIMTYQLTVTDGYGLQASSTVNVQIKTVNRPPVASIVQPTQPYLEGSLITLDGSQSYDPDGDPLTYTWLQTAGPTGFPLVTLNLTNPAKPTFTAPIIGSPATYQFQLTLSDGQLTAVASVTLQTVPQHHAPIANAGVTENVGFGDTVTLDGTRSTDPDGNLLTYTWTQTAGPIVILNYSNPAKPTFTAPNTKTTLTFSLVVQDQYLVSAPSTVNINVYPPNALPDCQNAHANKTQIWPPNETFARVKIRGLEADPKVACFDNSGDDVEGNADADDDNEDNYRNVVRVTSITQDEKGIFSPDAIVQSVRPNGKSRVRDLILVRREETPKGNGRVYQINFTVTNSISGLSCNASVQICVPPKRGQACVNDGQNYNSFTQ